MATMTLFTRPASRQVRLMWVFRCTYYCEECTRLGSEWTDTLLTASVSWCPCCDRECEPSSVEEFEEEVVGWEDEDETV